MGIHRWFGVAMLTGFVLLGSAPGASAASYQAWDGPLEGTVDPIQDVRGGDSAYSGPNLGPRASLVGADLSYAELSYAYLWDANLGYADLRYADLTNAYLGYANLFGADLRYANLNDAYLIWADLSYANLSYANLNGASLSRNADLSNADLSYANLSNASLYSADLSNANLNSANLSNANLGGVDLTNALLFSADLESAWAYVSPTWTGAKYSLNAVDNNGNPIPDTVFSTGFDPIAAGMIPVPEPGTALLVGLGLIGLGVRRRS